MAESWQPRESLRYLYLLGRGILQLGLGLLRYSGGSRRLSSGYLAMVSLYCLTRGWSNFWLYSVLNLLKGKLDFSAEPSSLPGAPPAGLAQRLEVLKLRGFCEWENALSREQVSHLLELGLEMEMEISGMDDGARQSKPRRVRYEPSRPLAVRYDAASEEVLKDPVVQRIVCDRTVLEIAQDYLGAPPILDFAAFWWNTAFSQTPDSEAAQLYHFDLDRIRWLKFFFYVTDVSAQSGPHCFIEGTHLPGSIPRAILKKGYQRTEDEEVFLHFPKASEKVFTGKAGTMIAEDTIGLHKGQVVETGHRLILQLQYTSSLFGHMPEIPKVIPTEPTLREAIRRNPSVFAHCFETSVSGPR